MTEAEQAANVPTTTMTAEGQSCDDQQQQPTTIEHQQQQAAAAESAEQQPHYEDDRQQPQQNSVGEEQNAAAATSAAPTTDSDNKPTAGEQQQQQEGGGGPEVSQEPEQLRKVFVGGINYRTSEDTLKKHFGDFGSIVECVIMRDPGGRSRGFAFVTYTNGEMVDAVMKNRPHVIDGRDLDVKRATPKEDAGKPGFQLSVRKLFIGSVREGITEEDLRQYFGKYGNVTDCVVMKDSEGKHRGFGFVSFDDHDPVDKIIIEKNHTINGQVLDVKKALPKRRQANAYSPYGRGFGMVDAGSSGWYDPAAMDGYGYSMQRGGGSRYYGGGGGGAGGGAGGGYSGGSAGGYYGGPMRPRRGGWHSDRSY